MDFFRSNWVTSAVRWCFEGCTDWDALNYVQGANTDDGSCLYAQIV